MHSLLNILVSDYHRVKYCFRFPARRQSSVQVPWCLAVLRHATRDLVWAAPPEKETPGKCLLGHVICWAAELYMSDTRDRIAVLEHGEQELLTRWVARHTAPVAARLRGRPRVEAVLVRREVELPGLARSVPRAPWARRPVWCARPRRLRLVDSGRRPGPGGHPAVDWTSVVGRTVGEAVHASIVLAIAGAWDGVGHSLEGGTEYHLIIITHHESALTWSGVGVGGLGGLEAGVGEAGGPQHPGAGMVRAQRPREVSSWQRPRARVVQTEPGAVLAAGPAAVRVVVLNTGWCQFTAKFAQYFHLHCVHAGRLLLGLHLELCPGEAAGHGGAEEDVDAEHQQEEDPEHHAEPQQPARAQLAVARVGWG